MKIKELIAALKEFDPEALVVLSSDSEGNNFSELHNSCIGDGYWNKKEKECYFEKNEGESMNLPECVFCFRESRFAVSFNAF